MASILKVDTIQDQSGNNIINENANTITIGASGDTITIPSGATFDASSGSLAGTLTTAAQPNITSVGTLTSFASTGIDDNATSNAITIESTERVQFTRPRSNTLGDSALEIQPSDTVIGYGFRIDQATNSFIIEKSSPSGSEAERMRIDSSGNVGIGTSSPSVKLEVSDDIAIRGGSDRRITLGSAGTIDANDSNHLRGDGTNLKFNSAGGLYIFEQNGTEAMRIDGSGNVIVSNTTLLSSSLFTVDGIGEVVNAYAARVNNNAYWNFVGHNPGGTVTFNVYGDGNVENTNNSYGAISDERIKQDIRDSNSQWNDIKNIRVRNFKKKDDVRQYGENAWEQIGVIAQELETVSPRLIKHSNPTPSDILSDASFGTLYEEGDEIPEGKKVGDVKEIYQQVKGVSYSVLYMKAIKALQEAMERIETLEAKNTELEARITALENK